MQYAHLRKNGKKKKRIPTSLPGSATPQPQPPGPAAAAVTKREKALRETRPTAGTAEAQRHRVWAETVLELRGCSRPRLIAHPPPPQA